MTRDNIISLPDADKIEEEASVWVMRFVDGDASKADREELARWLSKSPQHREAFEKLSKFCGGLDFIEGFNDYAESDAAKASVRQGRGARRFRMLRPVLTGAIAASVAVLGAIVAVQLFDARFGRFEGTYQTAVGEQETVNLPDGSQIILNTNSAVKVVFADNARLIALTKGEAHFDVAPNKEKPFSVETSKGSVTAVGTAFSVHLREDKLNVVVTEGRVALRAALGSPKGASNQPTASNEPQDNALPRAMEVSAGQSAVIDQGIEEVFVVKPAMLEKATDWQDGELSFRGETLEEVIEDIGRYTNVRIEIGDEGLRKQKIVAYYKVGDVERMFEALNVMANIEVERVADDHVRLYRAN